jgi:hypothetical protein
VRTEVYALGIGTPSNQRGGRVHIGRDSLESYGGYLASPDEREVVADGGPWETVDEALAWARQQAREVVRPTLVRVESDRGRRIAGAIVEFQGGTYDRCNPL